MYEKWTQTKDSASLQMNEKAIVSHSNGMTTEMRSEVSSTKNKSRIRETSSRLKKKKSVIPKSSIKKANDMSNTPDDLVFSPGDRRTSSKLHSSTMKKSNTMGVSQSRAIGSISSSNRFLFRGNEEFHHTVGNRNEARNNQDNAHQALIVGSNSKPKKKDYIHR